MFEFKKGDIVVKSLRSEGVTILETVTYEGVGWYVIGSPSDSESHPQLYSAKALEALYSPKREYAPGDIYLSADGSKAFRVSGDGEYMNRLFHDADIDSSARLQKGITGWNDIRRYESEHGPLIKWTGGALCG